MPWTNQIKRQRAPLPHATPNTDMNDAVYVSKLLQPLCENNIAWDVERVFRPLTTSQMQEWITSMAWGVISLVCPLQETREAKGG